MAVDADITTPARPPEVVVPTRTHRVRAWVLLAFAAWNVWVWTTRAVNLLQDRAEWSVAFVAVHLVLFAGGLGGGAVLAVIGWRMRREARRTGTSA